MLARAFGDLVDDLSLGAKSDADDVGVVRRGFGEYRAIGRVMPGRKHLIDVDRDPDTVSKAAAANRTDRFPISRQHDDWLYRESVINIAGGIAIGFSDDLRRLGDHAAREKRRHVERLPGRKIVSEDDHEFCIEHEFHPIDIR
jgi:hypothetical protein